MRRASSGGSEQGPRRPGRKPSLTTEAIAEAVLAVGFDRVTVAAVAEQLGVSASGLYRYIEVRDDLIAIAADYLISGPPRSDADNWVDLLRDECWARYHSAAEHPGVVRAIRASTRDSQAATERNHWVMRRLHELGLSAADADLVVELMIDVVDEGIANIAVINERVAAEGTEAYARLANPLGGPFVEAYRELAGDPIPRLERRIEVLICGLASVVGTDRR
ncbi:MAG: TetR family transcriptional regulator [Actinomycetota bacterium]